MNRSDLIEMAEDHADQLSLASELLGNAAATFKAVELMLANASRPGDIEYARRLAAAACDKTQTEADDFYTDHVSLIDKMKREGSSHG